MFNRKAPEKAILVLNMSILCLGKLRRERERERERERGDQNGPTHCLLLKMFTLRRLTPVSARCQGKVRVFPSVKKTTTTIATNDNNNSNIIYPRLLPSVIDYISCTISCDLFLSK